MDASKLKTWRHCSINKFSEKSNGFNLYFTWWSIFDKYFTTWTKVQFTIILRFYLAKTRKICSSRWLAKDIQESGFCILTMHLSINPNWLLKTLIIQTSNYCQTILIALIWHYLTSPFLVLKRRCHIHNVLIKKIFFLKIEKNLNGFEESFFARFFKT